MFSVSIKRNIQDDGNEKRLRNAKDAKLLCKYMIGQIDLSFTLYQCLTQYYSLVYGNHPVGHLQQNTGLGSHKIHVSPR